jgi:tetratricopeptide (TPR) repeat protein
MLNSYCPFYSSLLRRLLWVVFLGTYTVPVLAINCNTSPVFAFSRALYLEQYDAALQLLPRIERERNPGLAQFLQQVLTFKRAYEQDVPEQQRAALEEIESLIVSLSKMPPESREEHHSLTLANIMIHTARLQLAVGNVLRASRLAKQGKRLLDEALQQTPDAADALLSNGLYFYYTGSENETLGWLMRWWSLEGDRARGREMMERAVEESADQAFEAARSLVSDVAWNRQETCRYIPLFNMLDTPLTLSINAAKEQIALALFCGQLDLAFKQVVLLKNWSVGANNTLSRADSGWLHEAYLYALAALGDSNRLKKMLIKLDPDEDQRRYWQTQFSLAKALDTQGAHGEAEGYYRSVMASSPGQPYQALASAYLQRPYQKPRLFKQNPVSRLQFACGR